MDKYSGTSANDIPANPYDLFSQWLGLAKESEPNDPNAMCLATSNAGGIPTNRMVLLNGLDERGFVFYTNSESRKGENLAENPYAALCFHWKTLRKQVRVEGRVEMVSAEEADLYYASRPRGSRIGAWASKQSRPLPDFQDLVGAVATYEQKYENKDDIPRPPHWNGYRVIPNRIEFWIDGQYRLHRRYVFVTNGDGWSTGMIYP